MVRVARTETRTEVSRPRTCPMAHRPQEPPIVWVFPVRNDGAEDGMWKIAGRLLAAGTSSAAISDNGNIRGLRLSPPPENRCTGFPRPQLSSHTASNTMTVRKRQPCHSAHEDQSLRCIFDADRQYLVWCLSQSWFRTKFGNLFDIIVEMFHRADERWSEK